MSLEEIQQKLARLRHVQPPEAKDLQAKFKSAATQLCADDEAYNRLVSEASIENYYDHIKHLTFETWTISFTDEQVRSLVHHYEKFLEFRPKHLPLPRKNRDDPLLDAEYLDWQNEQCLMDLVKVIDDMISSKGLQQCGAFVRLSTMSPKDACVYRMDFPQFVKEAEARVSNIEKEQSVNFGSNTNRRIYALGIAGTTSMCVRTGREAVQLLVESDRSHQELEAKLRNGDKKELNLIIRRFEDIDPGLEFRCFMSKGKVTGITQYNPLVLAPHIIANKDAIKTQITSYLEREVMPIVGNLGMRRCTIDVVIAMGKPGTPLAIRVIELNALAEFTGTCLFSLDKERDLLLNGAENGQTVFRCVESEPPFIKKTIEEKWSRFL